jgi:hypothetical protein
MRSLKIVLGVVVATLVATSCDPSDDVTPSEELSPFALNYLNMKMGSMSANSMASPTSFTTAANESFNRLSQRAGLSGGRMRGDSTDTGEDTTYYPQPWVSCANITTVTNDDNSVTTSYDYGDGCLEGNEYFSYLMFGKYTYTYLYENEKVGSLYRDRYYGNYRSENYGGEYYWEGDTSRWETNGESTYSGVSQYDTATQKYKGSYEYNGHDTYTYNGVTYSYSGVGKYSYDQNGSIAEKNDYTFSSPDYTYNTRVLEPLVTRYDCYSSYGELDLISCFMPIYVSGREEVTYRDGDKEGSFIIDYGDGKCDDSVIIIENGNAVHVNLYDVTGAHYK